MVRFFPFPISIRTFILLLPNNQGTSLFIYNHVLPGTESFRGSELKPIMENNPLKHFKNDIPSGLVVFLVALPLCLGIALASGAPLVSGLITGIIGGVVVGALSGSHVSVSGPAAGLTVIVLDAIYDLGTFEAFLVAVIIAGIIQLGLGIAKAGLISHYFPSSVIKGMLAGIGLILILKQIPHALGFDADYEGDFAFLQPDGENTFSELLKAFDYLSPTAVIISSLCLFIMIVWDFPALKRYDFFRLVPGGLIAVLVGIGINQYFTINNSDWALTGNHMVTIPANFFGELMFPDFSILSNLNVWITAFTIAIVASLETLLCIEASDKLDKYHRITSTNRELRAQGIGNIVAGFLGGLPMTSVIVRSSTNIESGARTKMSAIFHGILLLGTVVLIPNILNLIPLSALAAILLVIGYKLAKVGVFKQMYRLGWSQFLPFIITILGILFTDLLKGIVIGMVVSIFYILRNVYRSPYHFSSEDNGEGKEINIVLAEEVTFLNKGAMLITLRDLPENSTVIIDGKDSKNIDYDVKEVISNFRDTAKNKNIDLTIKNIDL
jgi:MFS superfamily sulfate permease-like transporter